MELFYGLGTTAVLVITVLAIALAVCWVLLPFALFGTKPLLKQLIREQERTNRLLEDLKPPLPPLTDRP